MILLKLRQPALLAGALALAGSGCATTGSPLPPSTSPSPALAELMAEAPERTRLRTVVDRERGEVVLLAGPFSIPAAGDENHAGEHGSAHHEHGHHIAPTSGHDQEERSPLFPLEWPVDGWLRGFGVALFDAHGNRLSRDLLHHLITVNFDRRQIVYPVAERTFGVGQETQDVVLPSRFGIPLRKGQFLGVYTSWHNPTGKDLHGVHLEVRIPFRAADDGRKPREVLPIYMDVNNVIGGTNAYDLPPGRSVRTYEFSVPVGGRLLGLAGHLHDYGVAVRLEDAETGEVLAEVAGIRDEEGRILNVEQKVLRRLRGLLDASVRLEAGHRYRVMGIYENPLPTTIPAGAMAHMVGIFEPDAWDGWEALDRRSPLYRADLSGLPDPLEPLPSRILAPAQESDALPGAQEPSAPGRATQPPPGGGPLRRRLGSPSSDPVGHDEGAEEILGALRLLDYETASHLSRIYPRQRNHCARSAERLFDLVFDPRMVDPVGPSATPPTPDDRRWRE
jgi:hypothetical protein